MPLSFPVAGCLSLESIRAGEWKALQPRSVRILASRFIQMDAWLQPRYFTLEPGEFIQGLLATLTHHRRVYVVTVPAPAEHAGERWEWPRIV